jgi:hypothetical protein
MSTHVVFVTHKKNFPAAFKESHELNFYTPQCIYDPPQIAFTERSLEKYQKYQSKGFSPVKDPTLYANLLAYCKDNASNDLTFISCTEVEMDDVVLDNVTLDDITFDAFEKGVKDLSKDALIFIREYDYDENPEE